MKFHKILQGEKFQKFWAQKIWNLWNGHVFNK